MNDSGYVPPASNGIQQAVIDAYRKCHEEDDDPSEIILSAAIARAIIKHLSENPIVPSEADVVAMVLAKEQFRFDKYEWVRWAATEWQRRMFADPLFPTSLRSIWDFCSDGKSIPAEDVRKFIFEAYKIGMEAR
jgi:hypothetical protein